MLSERDSTPAKFDAPGYRESFREVLYRKLFLHALGMNPNGKTLGAYSLSGILENIRRTSIEQSQNGRENHK